MRVLVVEPERVPYEKEIDGSLKSMQEIVDGTIQAVYPYEELVCLVCNDEGKINGMPLNRVVPEINDIIAGTFLVCGLGEESFESLDKKQIEQFKKKFFSPELFLPGENGIMVLRNPPSAEEMKWALAKEAELIPEREKEEPKKSWKESDKKPKQPRSR